MQEDSDPIEGAWTRETSGLSKARAARPTRDRCVVRALRRARAWGERRPPAPSMRGRRALSRWLGTRKKPRPPTARGSRLEVRADQCEVLAAASKLCSISRRALYYPNAFASIKDTTNFSKPARACARETGESSVPSHPLWHRGLTNGVLQSSVGR